MRAKHTQETRMKQLSNTTEFLISNFLTLRTSLMAMNSAIYLLH